jgi:hypothetical protein
MPACKHCGEPTVVDDAGVVCTGCAELVEPSLIVLTSDVDYPAPTTYDGWNPVSLKTVKTGRNRYLSGQGKEARDNKNLVRFISQTPPRLAYLLLPRTTCTGSSRTSREPRSYPV